MEEILKAAVRAGKITTQLLAFSRQQVLHPADLQLDDVVEELVAGPPAHAAGQRPGGDGAARHQASVVHADRTQLEQVLINLDLQRPGRHAGRRHHPGHRRFAAR